MGWSLETLISPFRIKILKISEMSTESILTNTDEYLRYKNGKNELVKSNLIKNK